MANVLKCYWWVLLVALLAGVLHVAPYIYFEQQLGGEYQGVHMAGAYDEDFYLSFVNQARVGKSAFANPYIYENRDQGISFRYQVLDTLIGWSGRVLNLSMDSIALAIKFFSTALLFIVLFVLGKSLTKSAVGGVLVAIVVELGNEIARLEIEPVLNTIFHWQSSFNSFLFYDRPIYPSVTAIFFFFGLYLVWKLLEDNKRLHAILLGVLVGIISYLYFYFWVFLTILICVMIITAVVRKEYALAKNFVLALIIGTIISVPFLVGVYGTLGQGSVDTANIAKNFVSTHRIIVEKVILAPLIILAGVWYFLRSKKITLPRQLAFLFACLLAGLIASNQQVFTGMEVQQHHFHFMTNIPILLLTAGVLLWYLLGQLSRSTVAYRYIRAMVVGVVFIVVIAHATGVQASSYRFWSGEFTDRQRWMSAFRWLNTNTSKDDVVLSSRGLSESVPIYTHNYVYGALHAMSYPVPIERLEHNYFTQIYLDGVRTTGAREYLQAHRDEMGQYVYEGQYWRATCGSFGCFPDSTFDKLVADYQTFVSRPFESELNKYRLDYVVWDKKRDPNWSLDQYKSLKQIFEQDKVVIYTFKL
ncbi:MAG TPA: hypothetical protein VI953_02315 [Candidatus Paceibacterota bacterium]